MSGATLQAQALDANANAVDLTQFPTALTGVSWTSDNGGVVVPAATTAAGLQATLTVTANGTYNVAVSGTNVAGTMVQSASVAVVVTSVQPTVPTVVTLTVSATAN